MANLSTLLNSSNGSGTTNNFIQSTPPIVAPGVAYTWWDTSGGNLTLWIEDGL